MSACRFAGRNQPRIVPGRHTDECPSIVPLTLAAEPHECTGCQPCTANHCRVCAVAHAEQTCPDCLDETRDHLTEINRMCASLPAEVEHKGQDSEAMNLLGPAADPDARQYVEASYLGGRLPEGWIEANHGRDCPLLAKKGEPGYGDPCTGCAGDELHPLIVLGGWASVYREAFGHDDTAVVTVADEREYLDRNLMRAAAYPHVPFEDFARDVRRCRVHIENVLHDGEQVDSGAPCFRCNTQLERVWGRTEKDDGWRCPKCGDFRSPEDYRRNVAQDYLDHSDRLTLKEIEQVLGIPGGTLRAWASGRNRLVGGQWKTYPPRLPSAGKINGRKVYRVNDAIALRDEPTGGGDVAKTERVGA